MLLHNLAESELHEKNEYPWWICKKTLQLLLIKFNFIFCMFFVTKPILTSKVVWRAFLLLGAFELWNNAHNSCSLLWDWGKDLLTWRKLTFLNEKLCILKLYKNTLNMGYLQYLKSLTHSKISALQLFSDNCRKAKIRKWDIFVELLASLTWHCTGM